MKFYSCAEVSSPEKKEEPVKFDDLCPVLLYEIASYLENPFFSLGHVNRYFKNVFSKNYPVKRFFNERFNIPEFVTEDVDDNEPDLKYLLKYSRFSNSNHVYTALRTELLYGCKFNKLVPHIVGYLRRFNESDVTLYANTFLEANKFEHLFQGETPLINYVDDFVFSNPRNIRNLQEFLYLNPQHIQKVHVHLKEISSKICETWIKIALVSNMPDMFFIDYSASLQDILISKIIYIGTFVLKKNYIALYHRLNDLINQFFHERYRDVHMLMNLIRFGPDDPNIYESQIRHRMYIQTEIDLFCHCASLSNKMTLFDQLIQSRSCSLKFDCIGYYPRFEQNLPIEMYKTLFDVYRILPKTPNGQDKYCSRTEFLEILSDYCRVGSFECHDTFLVFEFITPSGSVASGIPERVLVKIPFETYSELSNFLFKIPKMMKFDNVAVFETFLVQFLLQKYKSTDCYINANNLKLIIKSESIRQLFLINKVHGPKRPLFSVSLNQLLQVVDEPVVPISDFVHLQSVNYHWISKFKTKEKLQRLEILFNCSVARFIYFDVYYFEYRHVFKYLAETKQLSTLSISMENRKYLEIDFPEFNK